MSGPSKGPEIDCHVPPSLLRVCHSYPLVCPSGGYLTKACAVSLWDRTLGYQAGGRGRESPSRERREQSPLRGGCGARAPQARCHSSQVGYSQSCVLLSSVFPHISKKNPKTKNKRCFICFELWFCHLDIYFDYILFLTSSTYVRRGGQPPSPTSNAVSSRSCIYMCWR